jgi:ABC-type sugar transport system ATPase subunit
LVSIKLENVTKKFGDVIAVDNLNLEIEDKCFVSLLGPSGCGKTTTLRMIAGVEKPTSGTIYFDDTPVNDLPPKDRDVAMVFQFYVMYPGMNAFDQIAFPLKVRKLPRDEIVKRVKEAASLLNIEHILDQPVSKLNIAEQQRIEIARAIVRKPRVYLLDEPLTNLDAKMRVQMRGELKHLFETLGVTTVYVTHDQIEAMSVADKIAVMNFGKLEQYDAPTVLYEKPKNLFVAGFIGSPPMNFIDCSLIESGGRFYLDAGAFKYDVTDMAETIKEKATSNQLTLGIRPEHVKIKETREKDAIQGKISLWEPMGYRCIAHIDMGGISIQSNTTLQLNKAETIWISFDKKKIHIFDKKSGELII